MNRILSVIQKFNMIAQGGLCMHIKLSVSMARVCAGLRECAALAGAYLRAARGSRDACLCVRAGPSTYLLTWARSYACACLCGHVGHARVQLRRRSGLPKHEALHMDWCASLCKYCPFHRIEAHLLRLAYSLSVLVFLF